MKAFDNFVKPSRMLGLGLMSLFSTGMASAISIPQETVVPVGAGQTIQSAYDGIPSAFTGKYVIELQSGYDPTTETYPIILGAKSGSSATNTITIKPATGVTKTISAPAFSSASAATSAAASTGCNKFIGNIGTLAAGYKIFGLGFAAEQTVSDVTNGVVTLSGVLTSDANSKLGTTWIATQSTSTIYKSASTIAANTNIATVSDVAVYGNLTVGMLVGGNGIPYGTTITALTDATQKKDYFIQKYWFGQIGCYSLFC